MLAPWGRLCRPSTGLAHGGARGAWGKTGGRGEAWAPVGEGQVPSGRVRPGEPREATARGAEARVGGRPWASSSLGGFSKINVLSPCFRSVCL